MPNEPIRFEPNGVLTLTTDFGTRDGYVGAMKGRLASHSTRLVIHDLAHAIEPQNVALGAATLRSACPYFPDGTVHLGVVDPGVGTQRAGIVVLAGHHAFVGPDNGLFSLVAEKLGGIHEAREIDRQGALASALPATTATTFHGRDIFAPTAAALALGEVRFEEIGPPHSPVDLALDRPHVDGSGMAGRVTHVDGFGNAITNISASELPGFPEEPYVAEVGEYEITVARTYGSVAPGERLALVGSEGFLEIAVREGSAAATLGLDTGTKVFLTRKAST